MNTHRGRIEDCYVWGKTLAFRAINSINMNINKGAFTLGWIAASEPERVCSWHIMSHL